MLYLTHSSYVIIGLLHYGGLQVLRMPVEPLLAQLQDAVKLQLLGPKPASSTFDSRPFPWHRAGLRLLGLTVFIALPAGIWYSAISLTSMTSLTALYNLNAFWAYILSIYYSKQERWELRSAMSVGIACLGVLVMTYGDSREEAVAAAAVADVQTRSTSPLQAGIVEEGNTRGSVLGDLLGLTSSLACGFYEVSILPSLCTMSTSDFQPGTGLVQALHRPACGHRIRSISQDSNAVYGPTRVSTWRERALSLSSVQRRRYRALR